MKKYLENSFFSFLAAFNVIPITFLRTKETTKLRDFTFNVKLRERFRGWLVFKPPTGTSPDLIAYLGVPPLKGGGSNPERRHGGGERHLVALLATFLLLGRVFDGREAWQFSGAPRGAGSPTDTKPGLLSQLVPG